MRESRRRNEAEQGISRRRDWKEEKGMKVVNSASKRTEGKARKERRDNVS